MTGSIFSFKDYWTMTVVEMSRARIIGKLHQVDVFTIKINK